MGKVASWLKFPICYNSCGKVRSSTLVASWLKFPICYNFSDECGITVTVASWLKFPICYNDIAKDASFIMLRVDLNFLYATI